MIPYSEPPIQGVQVTHPDNSQQIAIPIGPRPTRPIQNHPRPNRPIQNQPRPNESEPRPPQN